MTAPFHHIVTVRLMHDGFATADMTSDAHEFGYSDPADAYEEHVSDARANGEFLPQETSEMRLVLS
jgi:hypothetical protein